MDNSLVNMVGLMVQQGKLPQHLFKYRAINSYLDDIIINNRLWFSKATDFNDPFDCNIEVVTNNTTDEIRKYVTSKVPRGTPDDEIELAITQATSNPYGFHDLINRNFRKALDHRGVACFSKVDDNLLMWSHYSDYHRGCVFTFDVLEDPSFFVSPFNVEYQSDYPYYNHLENSNDPVTPLIRTKSCDWQYEQEVRVVKDSIGLHSFKKTALAEIIFGWRTPDSEIARIQKLAACYNYSTIRFKQARLKKRQFGLDIVPL